MGAPPKDWHCQLPLNHCPNTFSGSSSSSSSHCAQEFRRYNIPSLPASPCCTEEEAEGGRRRPLGLGRGASSSSSSSCCNLPESPEEIPNLLLVVYKGLSCPFLPTLFLLLLLWRRVGVVAPSSSSSYLLLLIRSRKKEISLGERDGCEEEEEEEGGVGCMNC